jgi:urease subunit alpha
MVVGVTPGHRRRRHDPTAGGIDTHIHFISPQQIFTAFASGVTTFIGGGTGRPPHECDDARGERHLKLMLEATDAFPMNFGFTAPRARRPRRADSGRRDYQSMKMGTTPAVSMRACRSPSNDVQVTIRTDTLNESGYAGD